MKLKLSLYSLLIIILTSILYLAKVSNDFYYISKTKCIEDIQNSFQSSILQEVYKRLVDNNVPYYSSDNFPADKETEDDALLISAIDTIRIKKTETFRSKSQQEKECMFLQSVFVWKELFIQLEDINEIWQEILLKKNISIPTGVKYRNRDFSETLYSKADSLFFIKSNRTPVYMTGIFNEISLEGHYILPFSSIIRIGAINFLLYSWGICILILLFIVDIIIIKKKGYTLKFKIKNIKISKDIFIINTRIIGLYICLFIIAIPLFITIDKSFISFKNNKEYCYTDIDTLFKESILIEVRKRLVDNNILYEESEKTTDEKPEQITFSTESTTTLHDRTEEFEAKPIEEKFAKYLQTIFILEENHIKLDNLDSIWRAKLTAKHIYIPTGVSYKHQDSITTLYNSNTDSVFYADFISTKEHITGAENEICIQGYYKLPMKSIIIYGQKDFIRYGWIGSLLLLCLMGIIIAIEYPSRPKLGELIPPVVEPEVLTIKKANIYYLNEYLELDIEKGILKADDGRQAILRPQMIMLFEEFRLSHCFYALDKDIRLRIWFQEDEPSNVLTQLISKTRDALKPIQELEIRNIRKRGYQLIIHPRGEHWVNIPDEEVEEEIPVTV